MILLLFALPAPSQRAPLNLPALSVRELEFIAMDRAAISDAYKQQLQHLFLTWAKDESGQPQRALVGAKQARSMYERAMAAIDERERRVKAGEPIKQ